MSGNHRMDIGDISQGKLRGKALENALAKALNDETPHVLEQNSTKKNKKKNK